MNVVFTVSYTGTPDADDTAGARYAVILENGLRQQYNSANPALPPKLALPFSTPAEIKASYLVIILGIVVVRHLQNIREADLDTETQVREKLTPAQYVQIVRNLNARLAAGETAASVVADSVSL